MFSISPQDVQCVSSVHTTPRAQSTAQTASVLLWHAVHTRPFTSSLRRLHRMKMVDSWSSTASSSQSSSLSAHPNFVFVADVGMSAVTWAVLSAAGRISNCKKKQVLDCNIIMWQMEKWIPLQTKKYSLSCYIVGIFIIHTDVITKQYKQCLNQ